MKNHYKGIQHARESKAAGVWETCRHQSAPCLPQIERSLWRTIPHRLAAFGAMSGDSISNPLD
jgi:hypothetical protein